MAERFNNAAEPSFAFRRTMELMKGRGKRGPDFPHSGGVKGYRRGATDAQVNKLREAHGDVGRAARVEWFMRNALDYSKKEFTREQRRGLARSAMKNKPRKRK